jgi:hypothetical protein
MDSDVADFGYNGQNLTVDTHKSLEMLRHKEGFVIYLGGYYTI